MMQKSMSLMIRMEESKSLLDTEVSNLSPYQEKVKERKEQTKLSKMKKMTI